MPADLKGVFRHAIPGAAGLLMALMTSAAHARECRDIGFPERVAVLGTDLTLNGLGVQRATFLKIDVYVAALYVTAPSRDPALLINADSPQQLVVHFLRNVGVDDVRTQWTRDFTHVAPDRPASLMQRVATLNSWLSDMRRGEQMIFIRQPGTGIQVTVDGVVKGTIPGEDFSRAFMSIWVGATPPSAALKQGLLGGACD